MSIVASAPRTPVVRLLGRDDLDALLALAHGSGLPTLADADHVAAMLAHRGVLGAHEEDALIGCACLELDVAKAYVDPAFERRMLPLPNAYLCGAYVQPSHRARGIGGRLYASRFAIAQQRTSGAVVVELLGTGTPGSIHPHTRAGARWYRRAGFGVLGHSVDADGGQVLGWPQPHVNEQGRDHAPTAARS
jgi:GNAT superfamily N-acetyltransferase